MVPALTGPVLVAAVLLAAAAPAKWRRPQATVDALRAAGLPASRAAVRLLAVAEVLLAAAVLLVPLRPVLLVLSLVYLGFAGFVLLALRAGTAVASCGCFGRPDTPASLVHLVVVLALSGGAAAAAVTGSASVGDLLSAPSTGLPVLAGVGVAGWLAWAALSLLPQLLAAGRAPATAGSTFRAVA